MLRRHSIGWSGIIFSTPLYKFGFGSRFTPWIKVLYSSPLEAVWTNNNLSTYFPLLRGTRQGCPLSPLLLQLAIVLHGQAGIQGIQRNGLEHKVSLYADYMLLFISNPLVSLPKTLNLMGDFGKISGFKVNLQKSEIIPVNAAAKLLAFNHFSLEVNTNRFKYLGV